VLGWDNASKTWKPVDPAPSSANSIQGVAVSATVPTAGQILSYNGTEWLAVAAPTGNIVNGGQTGAVTVGTNNLSPLTFETNNAAALTIDLTGNLGIGTTAPTAKLQLPGGTAAINSAPLKFTAGTSLTAPEAGAVEYNGTDLFYTGTNGIRQKIVGYDNSLSPTPGQVLSWNGSAWVPAPSGGAGTGDIVNNGQNGAVTIGSNDGNSLTLETANAAAMTIDATGKVGIGTTVPGSALEIKGAGSTGPLLTVGSTGAGGAYQLALQNTATGGTTWYLGSSDNTNGAGGGKFIIGKNVSDTASSNFTIDGSGNVGIGAIAPAAKLDIAGSIKVADGSQGIGKVLTSDAAGLATWASPGAASVSGLSAATSSQTLANNNFAQTWNWDGLNSGSGLNVGSSSVTSGTLFNAASTSTAMTGTIGNFILSGDNSANTGSVIKATVAGISSAAVPLMITNGGSGMSFRVNDNGSDSDTTPFVVDNAGSVGIGTTSPTAALHILGPNATGSNTAIPVLTVTGGNGGPGGGNGSAISITGGNSSFGGSSGGNLSFSGGTGGGMGGAITLTAGAGQAPSGSGASVTISPGLNGGSAGALSLLSGSGANGGANGAAVTITSGNGAIAGGSTSGGNINISGGTSGGPAGIGADIIINPGAKAGSGTDGNILLGSLRGNVGIGTTLPISTAKLTVNGSIDLNANSIIVGDASGDARSSSSVDIQSQRTASTQVASGMSSVAFGLKNTAAYEQSVAVGILNTTGGGTGCGNAGNTAVGYGNTASTNCGNATAVGSSNFARGWGSTAVGYNNNITASYDSAIAIGRDNIASGHGAIAFGLSNTSNGGAIAVGSGNSSLGANSSTFGSGITNSIASSTQIGPSNTAKMTILSSGSIGLGTTTPRNGLEVASLDSPYVTSLRVGGVTAGDTAAILGAETSRQQILFSSYRNVQTDTVGAKIVGINRAVYGAGVPYFVQNMDLGFFTLNSTPGTTDSTTEKMRIAAGGNVGIGTAAPAALLDVNGTMRVNQICDSAGLNCKTISDGWAASTGLSGVAAATTAASMDNTNYAQTWNWTTAAAESPMSFAANALTTGSILNVTSSNGGLNSTNGLLNVANTGASTNGMIARLQSNSTAGSGLTVLANGNVGIGTTNPTAKLQIQGTGLGMVQSNGSISLETAVNGIYGGMLGTSTNHPLTLYAYGGNNGLVDINPATSRLEVFGYGGQNSVLETLRLTNDYQGIGLNGIGSLITLQAVDNNRTYNELGTISAVLDDATMTSKDSSLRFGTLGPNAPMGTTTATERMRIDSAGNVGIGISSPGVALDVSGGVRAGSSAAVSTCGLGQANGEGTQRYNYISHSMEYCGGTSWQPLVAVQSTTPPTAPAGAGYFVLTQTAWDGNLGGRAGANSKCLTELSSTYTNWNGYTDASARGLLDSNHVRAFLCDGTCNTPMPMTTYYFATANAPAAGGASFTTDSSGSGPNDSMAWSAANRFSGTFDYWTGRDGTGSALYWPATSWGGGTCNTFNNNGVGSAGGKGTATVTDHFRWYGTTETCDNLNRLICFVNP
jgi:hypothetical protein